MLKHIKYYNSASSATSDTTIINPNVSLITDTADSQVMTIDTGINGEHLSIGGDDIGSLYYIRNNNANQNQNGQTINVDPIIDVPGEINYENFDDLLD